MDEKTRARLLHLAEALDEAATRRARCPIAHFTPHDGRGPDGGDYGDGQDKFFAATSPIVLVLCGNRWGKTHALVAQAMAHALGYYPWEVPGFELIQSNKGEWRFPDRGQVPSSAWVKRADGLPVANPGVFIVITGLQYREGIGSIIQPKWQELWPDQVQIKPYLGQHGVWNQIKLPNGSLVRFCSDHQPNLSFEGATNDGLFIDEPIRRHTFIALKRGTVDRNARTFWTFTPLAEAGVGWIVSDLMRESRHDVTILRARGKANPTINHEALERFVNDPVLSDADRRARDYGDIEALGFNIVNTFGDHNIVPFTNMDPSTPKVCVVDPHHSRWPAIVWAAMPDDEQFIIYREFPEVEYEKAGCSTLTNEDLAAEIRRIEGKHNVFWRVCDPKGGTQHAKVHGQQFRSFQEEMLDYGLIFSDQTDNDVDRGIQELKDACKVSPSLGRPRLLVMSNCKNTIRALQFWSYRETMNGELKPSEEFKDFNDCLRYLLRADIPPPHHKGGTECYLVDQEED